MSTVPDPQPKSLSELKSSILRPATTSHFQCWFNPPPNLRTWVDEHRIRAGLGNGYKNDAEFYSLSCSEASLPGSSLATHELNNDFTGVTERHVYRRQYDNNADFTFYVDNDYDIIFFFENWMSYIVDEQYTGRDGTKNKGIEQEYFYYRVNYPGTTSTNGYKTTVFLNKFEKDYTGRYLRYRFLNAYPISISSMPVSYDTSQLLKCTVSFNYSRYVVSGEYHTPFIGSFNDPNSGLSRAARAALGEGEYNPNLKYDINGRVINPEILNTEPSTVINGRTFNF